MSVALNIVDSLIAKVDADDQKSADKPRFELGYWNIAGYAAPARLMMCYAGCKFQDIQYSARNEWYDIKFSSNLDFPNIPYLVDNKNGVRLTESLAIYSYLARQLGIGQQCDPYLAQSDMIIGVLKDIWGKFSTLCYGTYPDGKDGYLKEQLPPKLKTLEAWIAKQGTVKWLTGDKLASCDFMAYYLLFANLKLDKGVLDSYPGLKAFYERFESLEFLKEYRARGFADVALNGFTAKFGNKPL